ncbi:MAG: L-cysteine desulfidase family protein [Candidatus Latescibacterota bacterium]
MSNKDHTSIISLLKREVVPALGCTEPAAVALSAAKARETLGCMPETVEVWASGNIIKNGMGVGIPGTGATGLQVAAALGAIAGISERGLEVLEGITGSIIEESLRMVEEKKVTIYVKDIPEKLYIETVCRANGESARVVISGGHTNITLVERNGGALYEREGVTADTGETLPEETPLDMGRIFEFSTTADFEDIRFVLESAEMNRTIAEEGLRGDYGLRVGKKIVDYIEKGFYPNGLTSDVISFTAAAVDARMAGANLPAMSNSGSGNQGITVTLPVVKAAERLGKTEEELARALTLAHLVSIHIKQHLGVLSALCGVVSAATGASCGITLLLGGGLPQVCYAVKNMIANISGMICDGAKPGCALKVSTGAGAAVEAALLAADGVEVSQFDGIIEKDIEKTIRNLGELGTKGMHETDRVILGIMTCK